MSEDAVSAIAYTDGAARGNPGPAGAGVHLIIGDDEHNFREYLGERTNNQAEYAALVLALDEAIKLGVTDLTVFADSELMVKQVNGEYKVKNEGLKPFYRRAQFRIGKLSSFEIAHVPRDENKQADKLANEAIDFEE